MFICKGLRVNLRTHFYSVAFVKRVVDLSDVIKHSYERETDKLVLSGSQGDGWDEMCLLGYWVSLWGWAHWS